MAISKIKKFLGLANNLTTTDDGYALDARQGKALSDQITNFSTKFAYTREITPATSKASHVIHFPAGFGGLMYALQAGAAGRCLIVGIYGTCKAIELYKGSNITLTSGTDTLTVTFSDARQYGFSFISLQGDLINDIYLT